MARGGKPSVAVLRLQIVGGCQLRCGYCRPDRATNTGGIVRPSLAERLVRVLARTGVDRVRLTGGEPLLHPEVVSIVERLARLEGIAEVALTSNGQTLAALAADLRQAGLRRVNVHIDSLRPDRYRRLCAGDLGRALAGLEAALVAGLRPKLNVVVQRGCNDDEVPDFCRLGGRMGVCVRFIELMDTGVAPALAARRSVPAAEIRARLYELGAVLVGRFGNAPAVEYRIGRTAIGLIASETEPFCDTCDRLRLDVRGVLRTCLYECGGLDLSALVERGESDEVLLSTVRERTLAKRSLHPSRGAAGQPRFSMAAVGG